MQPRVTACWSGAAAGFRKVWDKYYIRWFDRNYMKTWKKTKNNNFWSKLVFMAGKVLGFDMKTLSVEHFLPGVETIGDLIAVTGMGKYGLGEEELNTKIFSNHSPHSSFVQDYGGQESYWMAGRLHEFSQIRKERNKEKIY